MNCADANHTVRHMGRRDFIKLGAVASVTTAMGGMLAQAAAAEPAAAAGNQKKLIWGNLIHLSRNLWWDWDVPELKKTEDTAYSPDLRFDRSMWDDILKEMQRIGMNQVVIDLGDGVKYESHPELAVKGAWSTAELRKELARLRAMGLEPIPKLNFSTTHDLWLGKYARCVSTDAYYAVCRELIAEVAKLFDRPRFFHLGMDEENYGNQRYYQYVVIRQKDLWWHDLMFFAEQAQAGGSRPWIWSDYSWDNNEVFYQKMPRTILQSNWFYGDKFAGPMAKAFDDLEAHGYDQIPTGSNYSNPRNFGLLVDYCRQKIAPERLLGFLQTTWKATMEKYRERHLQAIDQVAQAMKSLEGDAGKK